MYSPEIQSFKDIIIQIRVIYDGKVSPKITGTMTRSGRVTSRELLFD